MFTDVILVCTDGIIVFIDRTLVITDGISVFFLGYGAYIMSSHMVLQ